MSGESYNHSGDQVPEQGDVSIGQHMEEVRGVIEGYDEKTPDMAREYEELEIAAAGIKERYDQLADDMASLLVTVRGLEAASAKRLEANDELNSRMTGLLRGTNREAGKSLQGRLHKLARTFVAAATHNNVSDVAKNLDILTRRLMPEKKRLDTVLKRAGLTREYGAKDTEAKAGIMRDAEDYLQQ